MKLSLLLLSLFAILAPAFSQQQTAESDDFTPLFNGKDLTNLDGDPKLWKVEDGLIVGTCTGPESPLKNSFLIWREGEVKDFELRATVRVIGDNNSGIQYRSRPFPEAGPWGITGYQSDIHPAIEHTGMTYEERGRGIFGLNGKNVVVDPDGARWLVAEHEPVKVDVSQWNEYTIIARGNHLIHMVNGQVTSELIDHDEKGRALSGLIAIQLHSGNANTVQIKDIRIQHFNPGAVLLFDKATLPGNATLIPRPGTKNPQGTGPAAPAKK